MYSLTHQLCRKVLLHAILAVLLAGGWADTVAACHQGKEYFSIGTSKNICNKTLRPSGLDRVKANEREPK